MNRQEHRQRVMKFVTTLPVRDLDEVIADMEVHLARLIKYQEEGYKYIQIYGPFYMMSRDK